MVSYRLSPRLHLDAREILKKWKVVLCHRLPVRFFLLVSENRFEFQDRQNFADSDKKKKKMILIQKKTYFSFSFSLNLEKTKSEITFYLSPYNSDYSLTR